MTTVTLFSQDYSFYPFRVTLQDGEGAAALYDALEQKDIAYDSVLLSREGDKRFDFSEFKDGDVIQVSRVRQWNARLEQYEPVEYGWLWEPLSVFPRVIGYKFCFSIVDEHLRKRYLSVYYHIDTQKFMIDKQGDSALLQRKDRRLPFRGGDWNPSRYKSLRDALVDQEELNHAQIEDMLELASHYKPFS